MLKVGVKLMAAERLFGGDVRGILEVCKLCDRMGVDEVYVVDHVAMSAEGHANRPRFPLPLDYAGWYEPFGLLHAIAGVTERVTLSSHIIIGPVRPAIFLAKQIATLDVLSNGRAAIGLGAGWHKQEFDAANMPFEGRFEALCEQVEACRLLWSRAPASYEGKTVRFKDFYSLPLPPQRDRIPISFGMPGTPRNLERIARVGVGYCPAYLPPEELAVKVTAARAAYAAAGRDPGSIKITAELHNIRDPASVADWDRGFAMAPAIMAAGIDVLVAHVVPACSSATQIEPFIERLVALKNS